MKALTIESYFALARVGLVMRFGHLRSIHSLLRQKTARRANSRGQATVQEICHAMDMACVFYLKQVLCLQRAVATTLVLRHHGWQAEMVIGTQILPPRSHAWVEVDSVVVNDKPYVRDVYRQMERC